MLLNKLHDPTECRERGLLDGRPNRTGTIRVAREVFDNQLVDRFCCEPREQLPSANRAESSLKPRASRSTSSWINFGAAVGRAHPKGVWPNPVGHSAPEISLANPSSERLAATGSEQLPRRQTRKLSDAGLSAISHRRDVAPAKNLIPNKLCPPSRCRLRCHLAAGFFAGKSTPLPPLRCQSGRVARFTRGERVEAARFLA